MRILRFIFGLLAVAIALCLLAILAPWFIKSPFLRFMDNDRQYYVEFAHACDSVLEQNPLGTNKMIRISGGDSSLPRIIQDIGPSRVTVSSNRVHIMVGVREFGISWEPQDGAQTNLWALNIFPEGPQRVAYVGTKP